ncbi:MAG: CinA family protein [Phycisphaerae bacterium]|nr:CinA family protein [Phycisphaerae bacterium]
MTISNNTSKYVPWMILFLAASPALAQPAVRYRIVVTGGELLAGAYADGHTFFITKTLRPLGLQCIGAMCVDDRTTDICEAMRFAADKSDLVIVTGGLGPTDNDVTREALRDFTGIPLQEHPEVLAAMAKRFNVAPAELRANLRRQTQTPTQGTYLKNANGTAVGLVFEMKTQVVVALPGPPRELQPMVSDELVPYLSRRFGTRLPGASVTLRFVGLGQSQIDQMIKDHVTLPTDVVTSSQFEGGRVDFTFSLAGNAPEDHAKLNELKNKIVERLDDSIYAQDDVTTLETCVMRLLQAHRTTLAVAEVGSGGALASALNVAEGTHEPFIGAYVAPTVERLHQMLGHTTRPGEILNVESLVREVATTASSRWAVAVGNIHPNGAGGFFVDVAFLHPDDHIENRQIRLSGMGESARARLVTELLDHLRRKLRSGSSQEATTDGAPCADPSR